MTMRTAEYNHAKCKSSSSPPNPRITLKRASIFSSSRTNATAFSSRSLRNRVISVRSPSTSILCESLGRGDVAAAESVRTLDSETDSAPGVWGALAPSDALEVLSELWWIRLRCMTIFRRRAKPLRWRLQVVTGHGYGYFCTDLPPLSWW